MIRLFDILFSFLGIIIFMPFFVLVYLLIRLESPGGGFYLQRRVGKNGRLFNLYKFRSMRIGSDTKGLITIGGRDPRITRVGYYLRKYKIDELPQFWNVLKGDMSFVGPRPEVEKYVNMYTEEQRQVLSVRPGITDYASIEYVDENEILSQSDDPDKTYVEVILPDKIKYNMKYINNRNLYEYFKIIFITAFKIIR